MRGSRDDASISKVVEWFRALALVPSFSLAVSLASPCLSLLLSLSLSHRALPSRDRIAVCRGICPWQFGFELFAIFFISFPVISRTRPGLVGSRADDVSDRVSISRLFPERSRISAAFK